MTEWERKIYDEIIQMYEHRKMMNEAWLKSIWWNKRSTAFLKLKEVWLYKEEIPLLSYLDKRRNLIKIPNYCSKTGAKINIKEIKEALQKYFR